jgi:hypothetical protein
MWNIFKFFFVWFWLGVSVFLLGAFLVGLAHPGFASGAANPLPHSAPDPTALLVPLASFLMCVPAYFLSRPKRAV